MIEKIAVKRYLCFRYYRSVYPFWMFPEGGMQDFIGSADTMEEAQKIVDKEKNKGEDWDILDFETGKIISGSTIKSKILYD